MGLVLGRFEEGRGRPYAFKAVEASLLLMLSSPSYECWPSVGLAAEPLSTPVADSLLDQTGGRLSAIEPSLIRAPAPGALAPMQIPVGETDGGESHGDILRPVHRMMSDATLDPVGNLGPAGMLPAAESPVVPTIFVGEASSLSGSPRQGVMTLDRGYRDAMPAGPPPDHP